MHGDFQSSICAATVNVVEQGRSLQWNISVALELEYQSSALIFMKQNVVLIGGNPCSAGRIFWRCNGMIGLFSREMEDLQRGRAQEWFQVWCRVGLSKSFR